MLAELLGGFRVGPVSDWYASLVPIKKWDDEHLRRRRLRAVQFEA